LAGIDPNFKPYETVTLKAQSDDCQIAGFAVGYQDVGNQQAVSSTPTRLIRMKILRRYRTYPDAPDFPGADCRTFERWCATYANIGNIRDDVGALLVGASSLPG
jgi:hypothetical protein